MIIVIANTETNRTTGRKQVIVSHGIDEQTGRHVILPQEPPERIGAVFDANIGEFVITEHK